MIMKRKFRRILVTGAAGYIGSHCIIELLSNGYEVIAIDNLSNSISRNYSSVSLEKVQELCGKSVTFYNFDLQDEIVLSYIFREHNIDCVIHLASFSNLGVLPLLYYQNSISGLSVLLQVMKQHGCQKLVYASSCVVYGSQMTLPASESDATGNVTTPYGRAKYFVEQILTDMCEANEGWSIIQLRHFNVFGAHPSGLVGYHPKSSSGLMWMIGQVAMRKEMHYKVFGGDYDTPDGSVVRDYVHVMDVAAAYVSAITKLQCEDKISLKIYNIGSGVSTSVFEIIRLFKKVSGDTTPILVMEKRNDDIPSIYANTELIFKELRWTPKYSLEQACADFWKWITKNPNGYEGDS